MQESQTIDDQINCLASGFFYVVPENLFPDASKVVFSGLIHLIDPIAE